MLLVLLPLISGYWSYLVNGFIFFAEEEILSPLLLGLVKLLPWGPVDQLLSSKQLWQATGVGSPAATPACPSYHSSEREPGYCLRSAIMIKYGQNLFIPLCMHRYFSKHHGIWREKYIDKYLLVNSGCESLAEDFLQIFFFYDKSGALSEKAENWSSYTESSSAVCPGCYQLQFLMKNYGKIRQKSCPQIARVGVG